MWESLNDVPLVNLNSGAGIKDVMEAWTLQSGYPLVTVKRFEFKVTVSVYIMFCTSKSISFILKDVGMFNS